MLFCVDEAGGSFSATHVSVQKWDVVCRRGKGCHPSHHGRTVSHIRACLILNQSSLHKAKSFRIPVPPTMTLVTSSNILLSSRKWFYQKTFFSLLSKLVLVQGSHINHLWQIISYDRFTRCSAGNGWIAVILRIMLLISYTYSILPSAGRLINGITQTCFKHLMQLGKYFTEAKISSTILNNCRDCAEHTFGLSLI